MDVLKKYLVRIFIGILIFMFLHVNAAPDVRLAFSLQLVDKIMMGFTVSVVVLVWEILDYSLVRFRIVDLPLARLRNLLRALFILTMATLPMVIISSWLAENQIKPFMACPVNPDGLVRDVIQGQVLAWLIIATKLFRVYSDQEKQMYRDLGLVQKELLLSKYQNLKNQVNPHFLFNSFSVLQNLIETDPENATVFLEKLSTMYRYLLEHKDDAMSSIEREIEVANVYIYLLKTRHENRLSINVQIDPSYYERYVPTLSLQMLIENAVKHNRFSNEEPLEVNAYIEDDYLIVKNQLRKKGAPAQSTRVGLENLRNQYSLQTDRNIVITSDDDFFTVKLPVLTGLRLV